ncbi:ParB N-terminal domain-containing protein [Alienimonas californiensis]|uniref:ParB-like nuclease domain protein n=1 Tax=Alienimonas californiensis TaxID=2527989 RepID=A0A517P6W4_9PLAN|nr:ParB N-terminal domain-containing protein [Alienimonas californiensis]QDT15104.1 ParB-like nuclease domain protein [Alienimonas californiensis]
MLLEHLPLSSLKPAPHNPRIALKPGDAGWRKLAASVRAFGLVQPLVYNRRSGLLVGGHQRLEVLKHDAAEHGGPDTAPCVVVDLPDAEEKALCIALNNADVGGSWDGPRLVDLLGELSAEALKPDADFDAALTGFDPKQLDALLMTPAGPGGCLPIDSSVTSTDSQKGHADETGPRPVAVALEVPADRWPAVRPDLDALVGDHDLTVHVTGAPD